jgi:hypothetical protein
MLRPDQFKSSATGYPAHLATTSLTVRLARGSRASSAEASFEMKIVEDPREANVCCHCGRRLTRVARLAFAQVARLRAVAAVIARFPLGVMCYARVASAEVIAEATSL